MHQNQSPHLPTPIPELGRRSHLKILDRIDHCNKDETMHSACAHFGVIQTEGSGPHAINHTTACAAKHNHIPPHFNLYSARLREKRKHKGSCSPCTTCHKVTSDCCPKCMHAHESTRANELTPSQLFDESLTGSIHATALQRESDRQHACHYTVASA
jgi:hypothetical protein